MDISFRSLLNIFNNFITHILIDILIIYLRKRKKKIIFFFLHTTMIEKNNISDPRVTIERYDNALVIIGQYYNTIYY